MKQLNEVDERLCVFIRWWFCEMNELDNADTVKLCK